MLLDHWWKCSGNTILRHSLSQLFIKRTHGSVPREAMWLALSKLGVPDLIVKLVRSLEGQDLVGWNYSREN